MTYKIPCRHMPSPARISIKYLEKRIQGIIPDLKIWVSLTEMTPQD